jgi:hypothetical protein
MLVDMAQVAVRGNAVADHLLELFDLGKSAVVFARPD